MNPDDLYLIEDMGQKCWTDQHYSYVFFVALPMLFLYVFGMPLCVGYLLWKNRKELTKENFQDINRHTVQKYHFLFKGYEPQFYFWYQIKPSFFFVVLFCIHKNKNNNNAFIIVFFVVSFVLVLLHNTH